MTDIPDIPVASERALSYPQFRRFYVGAVTGTNGGWISRILMSWLAWDLTHSATFVGLIAATTLLPVAIFGPFFGAIIDRMSTRLAFQRVAFAMMGAPTLLITLMLLDILTAPALFFVSLTFGTVMSSYHPVRQSLGPRLVERPAIGSVVALSALNFNIGRMLAPALGGLLIAQFGTLPAACLALLMTIPNAVIAPSLSPREGDHSNHGRMIDDLREGFRVVWQRWPIRRSILLAVASLGILRGFPEILSVLADGVFERGAAGFGLLTSAVGGGALIAAIFQVVAGNRLLRHRLLRFAMIWVGFAAILATAFAPSFNWALLPAAAIGFSSTYVGVSLQIGVQARLEDEFRGRVMSIWMLANTGSTSAFAFLLSAFTEWQSVGFAAVSLLVLCAVATLAIWMRPVGD